MKNLLTVCLIGIAMTTGSTALAKEYNKRTHIDPAQQVKVQRVLAKSYSSEGTAPQGVSNVGCGKLEIGSINTGPGQRVQDVDRDIIITGDVINVARGCRR